MATKHRTGCLIKRGTNFYVRWVVEGKVFSKALRDGNGSPVTTKREAEEAKQKIMAPFVVADEAAALESIAGKLEGRKAELAKLEDQQNPPLRIGEAWSAFLASPNRPDSGEETLYQYKCQWSAFSDWMKEKHAEAPALRDVTKEIAEDYAASLNGGRLSPNTYNKHLNLLTLVFRVLKHKAKLTSNHWEEIQRKRIATHSRRELTVDELKKVCQAATGELRPLLGLGIYSGLRLGDCATLRWGEVDLQRGVIRRIPNKTARRNPKPVIVPIHPVLRDMLATTPTDKRGDYVLPETATLYNRRTDLVTDMVQGHFASCGLKPHKPGTGKDGKRAVVEVGFHSLRHTFISLCRASDVPLSVVESLVGHSTPAMTKYYTHTGELAAGRAVAALPAVIGEHKPQRNGEEDVLVKVRRVVKSITAENWKTKRAELLMLVSANTTKRTDNLSA
jgi:integrase